MPPTDTDTSWSIGILCYNEAGSIANVVKKADTVCSQLGQTYEIIVVDDGSTDGCDEILKELAEQNSHLRIVTHRPNKGMGAGLHSVYRHARFDNVVVVPGDGQFDIDLLAAFPQVPENRFVSFYRNQKVDYNLFRQLLTLFNKALNRYFLGIRLKDVNWVKIYKNKDLRTLDLQIQSSLVESEICAKLVYLGRVPIEAPSEALPRQFGKSKGSFAQMVRQALSDMVALVKVLKQFKRQRADDRDRNIR